VGYAIFYTGTQMSGNVRGCWTEIHQIFKRCSGNTGSSLLLKHTFT